MATRPPTPVRNASLLSILVVVLAVAPAVDALSARASVRASVKVDPEADPSSFLPTWPTGTNDPCVYVGAPWPVSGADTGALLSQDCKSYICIQRSLTGGGSCIVRVNPGTPALQFKVLLVPESLAAWQIRAQALDEPARQQIMYCPAWSGPGSPIPPMPLGLEPCTLTVPWDGASSAQIGFEVPLGSVAPGLMVVYVGPPEF